MIALLVPAIASAYTGEIHNFSGQTLLDVVVTGAAGKKLAGSHKKGDLANDGSIKHDFTLNHMGKVEFYFMVNGTRKKVAIDTVELIGDVQVWVGVDGYWRARTFLLGAPNSRVFEGRF